MSVAPGEPDVSTNIYNNEILIREKNQYRDEKKEENSGWLRVNKLGVTYFSQRNTDFSWEEMDDRKETFFALALVLLFLFIVPLIWPTYLFLLIYFFTIVDEYLYFDNANQELVLKTRHFIFKFLVFWISRYPYTQVRDFFIEKEIKEPKCDSRKIVVFRIFLELQERKTRRIFYAGSASHIFPEHLVIDICTQLKTTMAKSIVKKEPAPTAAFSAVRSDVVTGIGRAGSIAVTANTFKHAIKPKRQRTAEEQAKRDKVLKSILKKEAPPAGYD